MSEISVTRPDTADAARVALTLRDQVFAAIAVVLALITLYTLFLDQGAMLSPLFGELAYSNNYLHELAHDGRHLFAASCH